MEKKNIGITLGKENETKKLGQRKRIEGSQLDNRFCFLSKESIPVPMSHVKLV